LSQCHGERFGRGWPSATAPGTCAQIRLGRVLDDASTVLKVDLHIHTGDDPVDPIPYTSLQLIDRAAALGFDALAITLHDLQLETATLAGYAALRGITLIPGIERTIEGKHVLLLNFSRRAEQVTSFDDLALLKQHENGLVVAPHAFFPGATCLRRLLDRHADLFDAVEYNAMFTRSVNFNRTAERWARDHRKPMIGNGDVHRLAQLGSTYSLVDAAPTPEAICAAIKAGAVHVQATPLPWSKVAAILRELLTARDVVNLLTGRRHAPRRETLQPGHAH
jgi:predicted metal-dependent phosphoesterase TrpH